MSDQNGVRGVCAAVLTPLTERLEPDAEKAIPYYRKLLQNGCNAINLLGTTGEALSLTISQRLSFMKAVAAELPVSRMMVGTSASALCDAGELAQAAKSLGFGGALIMPPRPTAALSEAGIARYYASIAHSIGDEKPFLYLYNFPRLSGVAFTMDLVDRLMGELGPVIAGIKDSANDLAYEKAVAQAYPQLAVFPSSECHLLSARRFGLAGCISGTVCLWPERAQSIWEHDDNSTAEIAQRELCALRTEVEQHTLIPAVRFLTALQQGDDAWEGTIPPMQRLIDQSREALSALANMDSAVSMLDGSK